MKTSLIFLISIILCTFLSEVTSSSNDQILDFNSGKTYEGLHQPKGPPRARRKRSASVQSCSTLPNSSPGCGYNVIVKIEETCL
ncbi:hypothetical protein EB796_015617 [Bugula neritina]|uniref:Uncharacterized protein n=1 Tax=Bugula neritina TaxID=10212 RepID=A0A7J7JKD4_BUGNE|nr:hypothetical protein EB796_015617 [Bugula neritina]